MPDDEEMASDPAEIEALKFLEDHLEDDTMTPEEEKALKKEKEESPVPIPEDVS